MEKQLTDLSAHILLKDISFAGYLLFLHCKYHTKRYHPVCISELLVTNHLTDLLIEYYLTILVVTEHTTVSRVR